MLTAAEVVHYRELAAIYTKLGIVADDLPDWVRFLEGYDAQTTALAAEREATDQMAARLLALVPVYRTATAETIVARWRAARQEGGQ